MLTLVDFRISLYGWGISGRADLIANAYHALAADAGITLPRMHLRFVTLGMQQRHRAGA